MTPAKPYLIRAIYEWIMDNDCTPLITVDAEYPRTYVPEQYIDEDNEIVLDIAPDSTKNLLINNEAITCVAEFDGNDEELYIPIPAVAAIYAQENDQGMTFPKEEYQPEEIDNETNLNISDSEYLYGKKPKLRVITDDDE